MSYYIQYVLNPNPALNFSMQAQLYVNHDRPVHHRLYAASRGAPLKPIVENEVQYSSFYYKGGAKMEELRDRALYDIQNHHDPESCIVYMAGGGLPSLTRRDIDKSWFRGVWYEEVIFVEEEDAAVERMNTLIDNIDLSIRLTGATPCFSTIVPMSLDIWNNIRLDQGKTHYLLHHNHYVDMQHFLINAIIRINTHIISVNVKNQVATPHMFDQVSTCLHGSERIHYERFIDGVHLNNNFSIKCAKKLMKAINHNTYVLGRALGHNLVFQG